MPKKDHPPTDSGRPTTAAPAHRPLRFEWVAFTVAFTGTGILMLEVLGTRIAGPIFGVSLYIWTALISVTLISLSLGYWLGGLICDRYPKPDLMYGLIFVAGVLIAFIPAFDGPVMIRCYEAFDGVWRVRLGVLLASFILFAPPLTLLAMISPYAIKLALADLRKTGKTAGKLYAISTVGSVLGAILTGYVLIPGIGVSKTLLVITAVILTPPVIWFVAARRIATLVVGLAALAGGAAAAFGTAGPSLGPDITMLAKHDSRYGQIKVLDQKRDGFTVRWMLLEGSTQTGLILEHNVSYYKYAHVMAYFLRFHPPVGRRALLVGLGGGVQVRSLVDAGYEVDAVEIDPTVKDYAIKYFGLNPNECRIIEEDGRAYLRRTSKRYDVVFFDVASGGSQPFHFFSREAFQEAKRVLAPGGLFAINCVGYVSGERSVLAASVLRTASDVFRDSRVHLAEASLSVDLVNNLLMFFRDEPFTDPDPASLSSQDRLFWDRLAQGAVSLDVSRGQLITDDWNPMDRWTAANNEAFRDALFESIGAAVLAY